MKNQMAIVAAPIRPATTPWTYTPEISVDSETTVGVLVV
jgi:hypothetical protein